jgi:hypothetical protein
MAHTEARAWWADVQHLRNVSERTDEARRRADVAERRASHERRHVERHEEPDVLAVQPRIRDQYPKGTPVPARRTVEIRGRTVPAPAVPRSVELDRRRPPRRPIERVGPRPDRIALWALLMGILLIVVAVGTADASVLAR